MTIEEREAKLEEFLAELEPEYQVKVYSFNTEGYRIEEISFTKRTSTYVCGYSYMRCEPESSAVILSAENFVIEFGVELHEEAKEILKYLIGR